MKGRGREGGRGEERGREGGEREGGRERERERERGGDLACFFFYNLLESDDESDDEFHERLDRALREGYVEIFTAKCGVSGPPGQPVS